SGPLPFRPRLHDLVMLVLAPMSDGTCTLTVLPFFPTLFHQIHVLFHRWDSLNHPLICLLLLDVHLLSLGSPALLSWRRFLKEGFWLY
ncbi:hypothetical protein BDP27DRAFT_1338347, partial [Rhodocollybia butyracea]